MKYEEFCAILNKHIFESEKKELLRKVADNPERFIGLFRPTKPGAKILQHLLQSHEIRMGDALEEIIEKILESLGYRTLDKRISTDKETLLLDQYFTDGERYWFIEQKVRDDHDSTKKRGQVKNFEAKLDILYKTHGSNLIGIMYFIDPDLTKNQNYYLQELQKFSNFYGVTLYLCYGRELFDRLLKQPQIWDDIVSWLKQWKDSLPELPEINFDEAPEKTFNDIKDLEIRSWRKIIEDDRLWKEGIIKTLFKEGSTLEILLKFFEKQNSFPYKQLVGLLSQRLNEYY